MKIKCRFILVHDKDNDPLIVNVDKASLVHITEDGKNSILFNSEENCSVVVTESVAKITKMLQEVVPSEIDDFILLHDGDNDHIAINVNEIMDVFMLPKGHKAKSKIYFNEKNYLYIQENVNKIYSLLCGQTQENTIEKDA